MAQGCNQANLPARWNKINIFGLQSGCGSWQDGGMASDAKSKKIRRRWRCIEPMRIDRDFFERQWWGAS